MVSYSHHEWNEHHKLELIQEQARPQLNMSNCSWLCQIINERTSRFSFYTWRVFNTKQLHTLLSWSLGRVREVRQGMNVRLKPQAEFWSHSLSGSKRMQTLCIILGTCSWEDCTEMSQKSSMYDMCRFNLTVGGKGTELLALHSHWWSHVQHIKRDE